MVAAVEKARDDGDTVGGIIGAEAYGVPGGLGEPVFDKLDAKLAQAMLSLPACKGFEIGSGFAGTGLRGSVHNDEFYVTGDGKVSTKTNNSGGIQGGISNGCPIVIRVALNLYRQFLKASKASIKRAGMVSVQPKIGRHDPCVLPRAVPIVEAMMTLVLMDQWLLQSAHRHSPSR